MPLSLTEYMQRAEKFYKSKGYDFNRDSMGKILSVTQNAMECHSKVFAFRVDLRLPRMFFWALLFAERPDYGGYLLRDFIDELCKLFLIDRLDRQSIGKRVHPTTVRYVWAREQTPDAVFPHYHLMIFLNKDAYFKLGRFDSDKMNLANKVRMAWFRALRDDEVPISFCIEQGLVHFPDNPEYVFGKGDDDAINKMLMRVAYLAKNDTKRRGEGYRCFGGSNN